MRVSTLALALLFATPSFAHDQLADGSPVPDWIKKSCCSKTDYHPLTAEQVHAKADGWHIDGYQYVIPYGEELPSPDGSYVGFWLNYVGGRQSVMYCFFVPPQSF